MHQFTPWFSTMGKILVLGRLSQRERERERERQRTQHDTGNCVLDPVGMFNCAWSFHFVSRASVLTKARTVMEASTHWQFISVYFAVQLNPASGGSMTISIGLPFTWISGCPAPKRITSALIDHWQSQQCEAQVEWEAVMAFAHHGAHTNRLGLTGTAIDLTGTEAIGNVDIKKRCTKHHLQPQQETFKSIDRNDCNKSIVMSFACRPTAECALKSNMSPEWS